MNWHTSQQWERDLEIFEQNKRIADSLERIANYLAIPRKPRQVVMKEVVMSPREEELLNNLHNDE